MGRDMSEQEWQKTLERHRKAQIARLREINRKDVSVTKDHRDEIARSAQGLWWSHLDWKPEPPVRWTPESCNRDYGSVRRGNR